MINIAQILDSAKNVYISKGTVARYGGDEFAIILPNTNLEIATEICELIKLACLEDSNGLLKPSIALGMAIKKEPAQNIEEILTEAEDGMYRNKLAESNNTRRSIITSLQKILGENTYETEEHALRLRNLALEIGHTMKLPSSQLDELALLAVLHDIGKVAIPSAILMKPGPLTPEEWEIMKRHPEIGYRIVQTSYELAHTAEAILAHHERWDGKGYPRGLKGKNIPHLSRILAIIDAYDAMTQERPYKKVMSHEEAITELQRCSGSQFDPDLVENFIETQSK